MDFFPVYRPASELIKAVAEELAEAQKRPETHYDATKEVRQRVLCSTSSLRARKPGGSR